MLDYEHVIDDGRPSYWERPKTTRRYLQPPKARKLITLWAEGKVVYGNNDWYESHLTYHEEQAVVFWPVWYKSFRPFDYRKTENYILRDGAPIHGLRYFFGGIDIEEEAFSDTKEIPTCFIRFRYTNRAPYPVKFKDLGFVVRKGSEKRMCYGAPDGYSTYLPEVSAVTSIPVSFSLEGDTLRDGCSYVRIQSEKPYTYDEETGVLKFQLALDEGETFDLTVSIGEGDPYAFSYVEEREKALSFWEKQMARIDRLPAKIQNDPEKLRIIRNFTVQFLQCFCRYTGEPWYIFRQGGLQRHIWPWDAMPALEAL